MGNIVSITRGAGMYPANFNEITKNLPDGTWVLLSPDGSRVIAQGTTNVETVRNAGNAAVPGLPVYRIRRNFGRTFFVRDAEK